MSSRRFSGVRGEPISRRGLLRAGAAAGVGAAGVALVGCGDDDDDGQGQPATAEQQEERGDSEEQAAVLEARSEAERPRGGRCGRRG